MRYGLYARFTLSFRDVEELLADHGIDASYETVRRWFQISCEQVALYKVASPGTIAIWLHGYLSGKRGDTVVDVEALKANTKEVRYYCVEHADMPLMQAIQEVLKP